MNYQRTNSMFPAKFQQHLTPVAIAFLLSTAFAQSTAWSAPGIVVVHADKVYTATGDVVANGTVVIEDGEIRAVGSGIDTPEGAMIIDMAGAQITPGLIDANAMIEPTDVMTASDRSTRTILHDFFCPRHKDGPVLGCCGSMCPRAFSHVGGKYCDQCGFPDTQPNAALGTRRGVTLAEQSSEVIPHTRVIDTVNLRSPDFQRLLAGGVTTVYVSPDPAAVISSQGAIVRTGGPIAKRIVRASHAVKAVMGSEPYSRGVRNRLPFRRFVDFHSRRPTTRMGVTWIFRKALHDAQRMTDGLPVYGADAASEEALRTLADVRAGKIPLRIQARLQQDILTAIRLSHEFFLPFVLEEATEAHLCVSELKSNRVPVIYGPIYETTPGQRPFTETQDARLHTLDALLSAGIDTALTANDLRDEDGLSRQAMYAIRHGVAAESALACVTGNAARLLGVEDSLGSLAPGKQADLVVWSGAPFAAASRPILVMIEGEIVLDRRQG